MGSNVNGKYNSVSVTVPEFEKKLGFIVETENILNYHKMS
jgi:hypothetical protein